jgi:hypothetical protein
VNALNNPDVGKYINEHFVAAFQKVATFRIVNGQKQGGNVAAYFCAPDGRVLHVVAGPVDAQTMLREAKWIVETCKKCIEIAEKEKKSFKVLLREAHAEKLRRETGMTVEAVTFDPDANEGALTYRDPSGRPLAPVLPPPPLEGPDVTFGEENLRKSQAALAKDAAAVELVDRKGGKWRLGTQGRVDMLMAAHSLQPIEKVYGTIFENILGEKITTKPVEIVTPFPWRKEGQRNQPLTDADIELLRKQLKELNETTGTRSGNK